MIKCKCGVELFDNDFVDSKWIKTGKGFATKTIWSKYRCPKCYSIKKVYNK